MKLFFSFLLYLHLSFNEAIPCLDNPKQPSALQIGDYSTPILFNHYNYASSEAIANNIAIILLREALGIQAEFSSIDSGGDLDAILLISGCEMDTATQTVDCTKLKPHFPHAMVSLELWDQSISGWEDIMNNSNTYESRYPWFDFGSIGYPGINYFATNLLTVERAWQEKRIRIDHYAYWSDPQSALYFTHPTELKANNWISLYNCKGSNYEGVNIAMAEYMKIGWKCVNGPDSDGWLLSPACYLLIKSNNNIEDYVYSSPDDNRLDGFDLSLLSVCITIVSYESWPMLTNIFLNINDIWVMGVFEFAAASASSNALVTNQNYTVVFDWFSPNPTFPLVGFKHHALIDYPKNRDSTEVLFKAVWSDLEAVSPTAVDFLRKIVFKNIEIELMLDQLGTGMSIEAVSCEWVKSYQSTWQNWISIVCLAGQYDNSNGECALCPAGTFSKRGSKSCTVCAPGTYSLLGSSSCTPCAIGNYQPNPASVSCIPCAYGYYSNVFGGSSCKKCPHSFSTLNVGSTTTHDCVCAKEYFLNQESQQCEHCKEGTKCEGGNQIPLIAPGYWAPPLESSQTALTVYRCMPSNTCPGGAVDQCAGNRGGVACGKCLSGFYKSGDTCVECSELSVAVVVIVVLLLMLLSAIVHISVNKPLRAIVTNSAQIFLSIELLFYYMQTYGLVAEVSIKWPDQLQPIVDVIQNFVLTLNLNQIGCYFSTEENMSYIVPLLLPLIIAAWYCALFGISKVMAMGFSRIFHHCNYPMVSQDSLCVTGVASSNVNHNHEAALRFERLTLHDEITSKDDAFDEKLNLTNRKPKGTESTPKTNVTAFNQGIENEKTSSEIDLTARASPSTLPDVPSQEPSQGSPEHIIFSPPLQPFDDLDDAISLNASNPPSEPQRSLIPHRNNDADDMLQLFVQSPFSNTRISFQLENESDNKIHLVSPDNLDGTSLSLTHPSPYSQENVEFSTVPYDAHKQKVENIHSGVSAEQKEFASFKMDNTIVEYDISKLQDVDFENIAPLSIASGNIPLDRQIQESLVSPRFSSYYSKSSDDSLSNRSIPDVEYQMIPYNMKRKVITFLSTPMNGYKTFNTIGFIITLIYISICSSILSIFYCYKHPNGKSSVISRPYLICYEDEWNMNYLPYGIIACALIIVGIFVYILYINLNAPEFSSKKNFLIQHKFLFSRFRSDCWWWESVLITRNFLLTTCIVISSVPSIQLIILMIIILLSFILHSIYFPLRDWRNNLLELFLIAGLALQLLVGMAFYDKNSSTSASDDDGVIGWIIFSIFTGIVCLCIGSVIASLIKMNKKYTLERVERLSAMTKQVIIASRIIALVPPVITREIMLTLSAFDVTTIKRYYSLINLVFMPLFGINTQEDIEPSKENLARSSRRSQNTFRRIQVKAKIKMPGHSSNSKRKKTDSLTGSKREKSAIKPQKNPKDQEDTTPLHYHNGSLAENDTGPDECIIVDKEDNIAHIPLHGGDRRKNSSLLMRRSGSSVNKRELNPALRIATEHLKTIIQRSNSTVLSGIQNQYSHNLERERLRHRRASSPAMKSKTEEPKKFLVRTQRNST